MRRVRLLVWLVFRQTPLDIPIEEWVERGAARNCKMSWEEYCALKAAHPDLWRRSAEKRERAKREGWPKQPPQLRHAREVLAPRRAFSRKRRPRFTDWAMRKFWAQRQYKRRWLRDCVLDRLIRRGLVRRAEYRQIVGQMAEEYFLTRYGYSPGGA